MGPRRFRLTFSDSDGRVLHRSTWHAWRVEAFALLALVALALMGVALWQGAHAWPAQARKGAQLAQSIAANKQQLAILEERLPVLRRLNAANALAFARLDHKQGVDTALWQTTQSTKPAADGPKGKPAWLQPTEVDALVARGMRIEENLGGLLAYWQHAQQRLRNTPSIRPARTAWLSSSFGVRIHPITHRQIMHKGLDMAGFTGMLIYAPADGVVIWSGLRGGYGETVVIDHGWGMQTHYGHLSKYLVKRGDKVSRGEPIAYMGSTGKSTGPHLHYEVRQDGFPLDPRRFILD